MSAISELIQQREALEAQIAQVRQTELADAAAKVKALVAEFGWTTQDIFGIGKSAIKAVGA